MAFTAVAARGSETEPFQLAGKNLLTHDPGVSAAHDGLFGYAGEHLGFYGWLRVANARIQRRVIVGLLDLPDCNWCNEYDLACTPGPGRTAQP